MRGAILRGSNLELARMQSTDARQGFLMERADAGEINRLNKGGEGLPGASMRGADLSGGSFVRRYGGIHRPVECQSEEQPSEGR